MSPSPPARRKTLTALSALAALLAWPASGIGAPKKARPRPAEGVFSTHPAAQALIDELTQQHGLPVAWVRAQIARARRIEPVRRLIMPPPVGVAKNWRAYHDRFVEPQRINAGLAFWQAHAKWLDEAEARWGVPPQIVVSIIGVETFYGRITGNFRVLDSLATLAFDFPPGRRDRSEFFRSELEAFLRWCHAEGLDAQEPLGSYAGAIGLPQFMPSSILRWGVDFDGDAHINLRSNPADAIGSVAHYLAAFGWQTGLPTHYAVVPPPPGEALSALLVPDILPSFTATQMADKGAALDEAGRLHEGLLALVELENGGAERSWYAGTTNFWAVTRYNWSSYYAMAVILLAEALRARR